MVKIQPKGNYFPPGMMGGLAGHQLGAAKGNANLHSLNAQLMKHAAKEVQENKAMNGWNRRRCWNTPVLKKTEARHVF